MPKIDVTQYIEQSGIRKARFGGYEPEDVRQAMLSLCAEYEQRLAQAEGAARKLKSDGTALEQHCRALTAQNQRLAAQNAALAGSSEKYSRRMSELDTQLSSSTEKVHSLGDQLAVFRLKNSDLTKENEQLKDRTEQAEAELRIKGRALDAAKAELEAARTQKLADADAAAAKTIAEARAKADKIGADAQLRADAIERAAHAQAQLQAQKLVDAAAAEANEVQNAHQLRLNNLHAEVRQLEKERNTLLQYLQDMGDHLLALHKDAANGPTTPEEDPDLPQEGLLPELEERPAPVARLDLSDEKLEHTLRKVRAEAAQSANEEGGGAAGAEDKPGSELQDPAKIFTEAPLDPQTRKANFTLMEEGPDLTAFTPAPTFFEETPVADPTHQTGPALTEVPGAIFSAPLVRSEEPVLDEAPPAAGPRAPLLPTLAAEEDEDEETPDAVEPEPVRPAADTRRQEKNISPLARRKAIRAIRALRRKMAQAVEGGPQR